VRVALVTNKESADLHTDGPRLAAAFERLGVDTAVVPWGGGTDWARFDGVLIRNTWDYVFDRDGFLAWAEAVSATTPIANSVSVLRWNTDKRYLRDLSAAGIPVVPTVWAEPGHPLPRVEWKDFVVKPSVSAGARLSARYGHGDDITGHVARIYALGAAAMIQPYVASLADDEETGTYVFGGEVSHAVTKAPVLESMRAPRDDLEAGAHQLVGPAEVDPRFAAFALGVLAAAPPVLYARVDTVVDNGEPMLMELEVTEPFLFLEHAPEAADRFAKAALRWLSP